MKRLTALILALILLFSLCGCAVKPGDNGEQPDFTDPLAITFDIDPNYQYGNRQKDRSGNFYQFGNEVVFSYDNGTRTRLYSYSLETGEVRRYCPDPVCDHKPCQSGIPYHFLEVYDGKLYGTVSNKPSRLNVVDGSQIETVTNEKVTCSFHYDGKLYVQTANGDPYRIGYHRRAHRKTAPAQPFAAGPPRRQTLPVRLHPFGEKRPSQQTGFAAYHRPHPPTACPLRVYGFSHFG